MNTTNQPVCTIVGMGAGIGMSVAKRFAKEGFAIAMIARRAAALETYEASFVASGVNARSFAADISDIAALKIAFDSIHSTFGNTDVLVYNAAVMRRGVPSELSPQQLEEDFRVNVSGALCAAQQVIPSMKAQKRGTILFTGGGLALELFPTHASLAVGKAGIRSLALSLYGELQPVGIHVATVTIAGLVKPSTLFDPDVIAEKYWNLYMQPVGSWEREIVYR